MGMKFLAGPNITTYGTSNCDGAKRAFFNEDKYKRMADTQSMACLILLNRVRFSQPGRKKPYVLRFFGGFDIMADIIYRHIIISYFWRLMKMVNKYKIIICVVVASLVCCDVTNGEDWPTYMHDNQRSGKTAEALSLPLNEAWNFTCKHAPAPCWPEPAKGLRARVIFDRAYHVAVAGGSVYFGSSADDKVYCLDGQTGQVRWRFVTGGPVRLAPTVSGGKVYVGSDDGFAYCLDGASGNLLWKYNPSPRDYRSPGSTIRS